MSGASNCAREEMKEFWAEHSQHATFNEMMLDSNSESIDKLERPEVRGFHKANTDSPGLN